MRKLFSGIILAFVMLMVIALPAYAFIDPPVSKTLVSQRVFHNLAEDGDMLIVFHWNWSFSDNYSSTPASDSIIYRLYDTDGSTLLSTDTPYVFSLIETNGYGNNVGSFYFNAADNMTWGDAYVINIEGWPNFFSKQFLFYTLTDQDYIDADEQDENRNELYAYVLLLADRFDSLYDVELKTTSDSGIILSSYGELFFRGAIPGLQTLCPQLFFVQVYVPEAMAVTPYDLSLQTTYTERLTGTDLDKGFTRLGELMGGMSKGFAAGIVFLVPMAFLVFWCVKKGWGIETGATIAIPAGIAAALIVGDVLFTILMIAALLAAMGIFYLVTFKRA